MLTTLLLLTSTLSAAVEAPEGAPAPPPPSADESAKRAAQAAEEAARAAARAAQAAERIADRLAPEPEEETEERALSPWSGTVGAGLISLTGNAESITFTTSANAERRSEKWIFGLKANAAYGQTRPQDRTQPAQVVAMAGGAQGKGERRVTPMFSGFLLAGIDTDHVKSVEYRAYGEGGSGIIWLEKNERDYTKVFLKTDLALRYAAESRYQYYPVALDLDDLRLVGPRVGGTLRYAATKRITFSEDVELFANVMGASKVLLGSTSKVSVGLVNRLALSVAFQVNHDSAPAAGKVPTDTSLTLGLEVTL